MSRERGFTLLEVVVALAIALMALAVLFKAAASGLAAVHTAGRYEEAVSRAQSHLAAIGHSLGVTEGDLQGDDGDGYHWRIRIAAVGATRQADAEAPAQFRPIELYAVTVAESWKEAGRERQVVLHTERAAPVPQGMPNG